MKTWKNIGLVIVSSIVLASCTLPTAGEHEQVKREIYLENKPLPEKTFIPMDVNVVSVGDSITEGVGDSTGLGGYVPLLELKLEENDLIGDVSIVNYGKNGNRSDQLLKRIKEDNEIRMSLQSADSVIVTIGGNDVMQVFRSNFPSLTYDVFSTALVQYEEQLTNVFSVIRSLNPQASIVLLGIYNPLADIQEMSMIVEEWNTVSKEITSQWGNTAFIEVADIFRESDQNLLHTDYFHPNDRGYLIIANRIKEGMLPVLIDSQE